ncbi:MAG: lysine biosynthesis protein LysW [Actinomycetota bacterium]
MLVERSEQICDECGETMILVQDYGTTGQAFECRLCGFWKEEIDLRPSILDRI